MSSQLEAIFILIAAMQINKDMAYNAARLLGSYSPKKLGKLFLPNVAHISREAGGKLLVKLELTDDISKVITKKNYIRIDTMSLHKLQKYAQKQGILPNSPAGTMLKTIIHYTQERHRDSHLNYDISSIKWDLGLTFRR